MMRDQPMLCGSCGRGGHQRVTCPKLVPLWFRGLHRRRRASLGGKTRWSQWPESRERPADPRCPHSMQTPSLTALVLLVLTACGGSGADPLARPLDAGIADGGSVDALPWAGLDGACSQSCLATLMVCYRSEGSDCESKCYGAQPQSAFNACFEACNLKDNGQCELYFQACNCCTCACDRTTGDAGMCACTDLTCVKQP